jgi:hypothetical protein
MGGAAGSDAGGGNDTAAPAPGTKEGHLAIINAAPAAGVTGLEVPGPTAPEYDTCK